MLPILKDLQSRTGLQSAADDALSEYQVAAGNAAIYSNYVEDDRLFDVLVMANASTDYVEDDRLFDVLVMANASTDYVEDDIPKLYMFELRV